jgi:magnesium chelatase family protein
LVARISTVAFHGIDTVPVDVQVQIAGGAPSFAVVGLPDNAIKESMSVVRTIGTL